MSGTTWIERKLKDFKSKAEFWKETAIIEFTEQIVSAMKARNLRRVDLANAMGKTKAHITQLLQGPNMTFGTAAELALSVGMRFRPVLEQIEPAIETQESNVVDLGVATCESWTQAMLEGVCVSRSVRPLESNCYEFIFAEEMGQTGENGRGRR